MGLLDWLLGKRATASPEKNLARWRDSGQPRLWIKDHKGRWNDQDWLSLLDALKQSEFWPMEPDAVGAVLEDLKMDYKPSYDELVTQLTNVVSQANYWGSQNGWPAFKDYPQYDRIRELGEQINSVAGFKGMQRACEEIRRSCSDRGGGNASAPAEYIWDGIGGWSP